MHSFIIKQKIRIKLANNNIFWLSEFLSNRFVITKSLFLTDFMIVYNDLVADDFRCEIDKMTLEIMVIFGLRLVTLHFP